MLTHTLSPDDEHEVAIIDDSNWQLTTMTVTDSDKDDEHEVAMFNLATVLCGLWGGALSLWPWSIIQFISNRFYLNFMESSEEPIYTYSRSFFTKFIDTINSYRMVNQLSLRWNIILLLFVWVKGLFITTYVWVFRASHKCCGSLKCAWFTHTHWITITNFMTCH